MCIYDIGIWYGSDYKLYQVVSNILMLSLSDNLPQHCKQYHQKANLGTCTATQEIQFYVSV